jgi:hypothetical protein
LDTKTKDLTDLGENHEDRIKALEALTRDHADKLLQNGETLDNHQRDIDELKRLMDAANHDIALKVDCDTFDSELAKITALLQALNKGEKVQVPV